MTLHLMLAAAVLAVGQPSPVAGSIRGVVVNASRDGVPVSGAAVVLRVKLEGRFVIVAEGVADAQGHFLFDEIPALSEYVYLPGANLAGIHYPGPRVTLRSDAPHARLRLKVHETVDHPSPLVLRRHEVTLQPQAGALRVTETLLIDNPTSRTYVGRPAKKGGRAATLRLSVPSDFRRTTFHQEFFGRNFTLIDGRLVTDIPWTPGRRELALTYVLPSEGHYRLWRRPLDLPCEQLRIHVPSDIAEHVDCNLPRTASQAEGLIAFESIGETLPPGHEVRLELGRLPVPASAYGRWLALAGLVGLILATGMLKAFRRDGVGERGRIPAESPAP